MQKTIKINPELFTIGKTDKNNKVKNKSIKSKSVPNNNFNNKVKEKLLDKIKNFQKNKQNNITSGNNNIAEPEINSYNESMSFLENLSNNYKLQKNKSIKSKNLQNNIDVNINLPDDFDTIKPNINKNHNYGCLKNGSLPTFREWKRLTQKNKETNSLGNIKLKINTNNNEYYDNIPNTREKKLTEIKNKFKADNVNSLTSNNKIFEKDESIETKINNNTNYKPEIRDNSNTLEQIPIISPPLQNINKQSTSQSSPSITLPPSSITPSPLPITPSPLPITPSPPSIIPSTPISEPIINTDSNKEINNSSNITIDDVNVYNIPKILRHTKTLKFKLGKNNKCRKIGIYIKNRQTQKNIKQDFFKLKNEDINEVKKYLRKHNLINSGTSAPNDVLRELYEKAILSGDVNNKNTNYLINNFVEN